MLARSKILQTLMQGELCNVLGQPALSVAQSQECMEDLEDCHQVLSLWLWLSYRLNTRNQFAGRDAAIAELAQVQVGGLFLLVLPRDHVRAAGSVSTWSFLPAHQIMVPDKCSMEGRGEGDPAPRCLHVSAWRRRR